MSDDDEGLTPSISERSSDHRLGLGLEGQRAGGLGLDQSVEDAAVVHGDHDHSEIGGDRGGGIDDVLEQVVEVVAAGAGQVGADLAPLAVEPVATGAEADRRARGPDSGRRAARVAGVQPLLERGDAIAAVGRRAAKLAPDLGEPLRQAPGSPRLRICRAWNGGDVVPVDLAGGDLVEQSAARTPAGRPASRSPRAARTDGTTGSSGPATGRSSGSSKRASPAHGDAVEEADADQPLADRPQVGRTALDQGPQRRLPLLDARLLVQGQAPDLVQGPAVAEEDVQLADLLAERPVG